MGCVNKAPLAERRYSNIDRIYQLPRPQPPGALVIIHLENAIRRGQTYYEWIAFFFDTNAYVDDLPLNTSEEVCSKQCWRHGHLHLTVATVDSYTGAHVER